MAGIYESDQVMKIAELGDTIFIAESEKTPFSRLLKRGKKPVQMLSIWPVQKYPERGYGGTIDGTDISSFEHTNRTPMEAYAMWMMTEGWLVTKLATLTHTAGVGGKEKAKQAKDDALILAQMIERQLLSDMDTQVENSPADAFQSRGVFSWLSPDAQTQKPVNADFRPAAATKYSGHLDDFLPSSMAAMLQSCATAKKGAVDLTGYVGIKLKVRMSGWAERDTDASATDQALQNYNINASEKRLIHIVDFFDFDEGSVRTFPSWYLLADASTGEATEYSTRSGAFLDMSMWLLSFLQTPASYMEPPKSGGPRGYHDAVYILKALNPLGQCHVLTNTDNAG